MEVLFVLPLIAMLTIMLILGSNTALAMGTYSAGDSGKTITVKSGDTFTVTLDENPTTGYSWDMTAGDGLKITADKYIAAQTGLMGSGGTHTWTIKALKPGVYMVSGTYKRPWEQATGQEKKYMLTVIVTGGSGGPGMPAVVYPKIPTLGDITPKFVIDFSKMFGSFPGKGIFS